MDIVLLAEILEIVMLTCFGISWPISVYKSLKVRTSVGKSSVFSIFIIVGYVGGIASKFLKMDDIVNDPAKSTVAKGIFYFALVMYFVNLAMISTNLVLHYVNKGYDKKRELATAEKECACDAVEEN